MARLPSSRSEIIILILLSLYIFIADALSGYELTSSDQVKWKNASSSIEAYPNSEWMTYTRSFDRQNTPGEKPVVITLENFTGTGIPFAWKSDKVGIFAKMKFYINGTEQTSHSGPEWQNVTGYDVIRQEGFWWSLSFPKGGNVWIAFPRELGSKEGAIPQEPNKEPTELGQLQGPDIGYNSSLYDFSISSHDPDGDKLRYSLNWGDGNITSIGPLNSGDIATGKHNWSKAGIYEISINVTDEHGKKSSYTRHKAIKIYWLVKVPQGARLQSVINGLENNTIVLLEGDDYPGSIDIIGLSDIIIKSNGTGSKIENISCSISTIGLVNTNNVILDGLNIAAGINGVCFQNCIYSGIKNSTISFSGHGIHIQGGHDNIIEANNIEKENSCNCDKGCAGVSIEDSRDNIVKCNSIAGLKDSVYYMKNSTFKNNVLNVDKATIGVINSNDCCCNLTSGNIIGCAKCNYLNDDIPDGVCTMNCSLGIRIGACI